MVCVKTAGAWSQTLPKVGSLRRRMTASWKRYEKVTVPGWQTQSNPPEESSQPAVEIDPGQCFQSVLGFGGAFTDASCYLFSRMSPDQRRYLLEEFFSPDGLHLSVCRTCIGSSDY